MLFNGASLLVDRLAAGDAADLPPVHGVDGALARSGVGGGKGAGGTGGAVCTGDRPGSLVDAMAWRKYSSLVELYGFLGGLSGLRMHFNLPLLS